MIDELLQLAVEGVDGSYWPIYGLGAEECGVVLGMSPEGIWETPTDTIWTEGAYQEGATYGGSKNNAQDAVFNVHISMAPGIDWMTVYSKWKQAWDFEEQSQLVATTPSGVRRLGLQKTQTPTFKPDVSPGVNNYGLMTMTTRAAWPFWVEDDVHDVFQSKASNRVDLSTPIILDDGTKLSTVYRGTVKTSNPTDRPMHQVWVIDGAGRVQVPDFSWITDPTHEDYEHRNRAIWTPSLGAGENLTIDTYPDHETWVSNINPMFYGRSGGVEFDFAVPKHTPAVNLPITCSAPGMTVLLKQKRHWTSILGGE